MVGWCRLIPGPSDLVFAPVLALILIGGRHALFNDPGTPGTCVSAGTSWPRAPCRDATP